ncbi:nucleotide exchange factor GrpE [Fulvivirga sp. M361]|uniref:nucleotide exchange factor GrpE n=1 Tax=Fulvivirga sp. M361 TaxID=2594266 RepID=UPI00117BC734|nr:nucleotide exchange factor GrpE [Fulvivirga sp. M361]TRX61286.1 nucleotide exchange factor GrpE [Fulvivirga sp. M361]
MKSNNTDEKEVKEVEEGEVKEEVVDETSSEDKTDNTDAEQEEEIHDRDEAEESSEQVLQDELAESKDKYLRLYSEFDNFRRRTAKEKLEMVQTANEDLIKSLLPVMDDIERAEKSFSEEGTDIKAIKEGIELIFNKFKKALEQKGLNSMDDKEGLDFDPEFHEAITQIPAPNKKLKGKVVDTVEKGYLLNEKVIRYAKVVIGN